MTGEVMDTGETTEDTLLDGRVRFRQPRSGYRAAIDTVLLAAAVPARAGERVADLGAGAGGASLALLARLSGVHVTGLEADAGMAALYDANGALNGFGDAMAAVIGNIAAPPAAIADGAFDHVMMNPPYQDKASGNVSPNAAKRRANAETDAGLDAWVGGAQRALKAKGYLTLVHRADRLDDIIAALAPGFGGITVFPLWPAEGVPAKRVIVRARKGVRTPAALLAGLVLHEGDGGYTPAADAVLRGRAALSLD